MDFAHFLVTRFNVESGFAPGQAVNPGWLARRLPLFEEYCAPSVANQVNRKFEWVILMDVRTPETVVAEVQGVLQRFQVCSLVLRVGSTWKSALRRHIQRQSEGVPRIITSRLDSDDCLAKDFIARVQEVLPEKSMSFCDFPLGYTYSTRSGKLCALQYPGNPFASLIEDNSESLQTVYCGKHGALHQIAPVIRSEGGPAWLQVIHGDNVVNGLRGRKVHYQSATLREEFGVELRRASGAIPASLPAQVGTAIAAFREYAYRMKRMPWPKPIVTGYRAYRQTKRCVILSERWLVGSAKRAGRAWLGRNRIWYRRTVQPAVANTMRVVAHLGWRRYCPICNRRSRAFLPYGVETRAEARCCWCGSMERHRLAWLYFRAVPDLHAGNSLRLLHVAPERCLRGRLQRLFGGGAVTIDLSRSDVDLKADLTRLPFLDATWDVIYCSHVLEHVPDDRAAMREIARVLKPLGWALLQVPIGRRETIEDPSASDPEVRLQRFGNRDHVRRYGLDFAGRLTAAGLTVRMIAAEDIVNYQQRELMGLSEAAGDLYVCSRGPDVPYLATLARES